MTNVDASADGGALADGSLTDGSISDDAHVVSFDSTAGDGGSDPVLAGAFDPSLLGPAALPAWTGCGATPPGRCYYASPAGSGDGCSEADPCRVATALPLLGAGDSLLLLAGTYDASGEGPDQIYIDKYFDFARAATTDARITIEGMPGQVVIMHGNRIDQCTFIDGESYVTIAGMVFEECGTSGVRVAEDVPAETRDIVIANNEFREIYSDDNMGAAYFDGSPGAIFENNIVHDFHYTRDPGDVHSAGLIAFRARDLTLRNNEVFHVGLGFYYKHGEFAEGSGGFTHVFGNYFHDTYQHGIAINQNRTEIRRNIVVDTGSLLLFQADGTVGDFLFDVVIEDNTFVRTEIDVRQAGDGFSGARRTTSRHNVFLDAPYHVWTYGLDSAYDSDVELTSDDNCFFASEGALSFDYFGSDNPGYGAVTERGGIHSFSEWNALGFDTGSVVADPQLSASFRVSPTSACGARGAY